MDILVNGRLINYDYLIKIAQKIDSVNYMDIVHDHILTGKSMNTIKYDYFSVNEYDYTKHEDTVKTCNKCNELKPIACFKVRHRKGKTFVVGDCIDCLLKKLYEWRKRPENKLKIKAYYKDYHFRKKDDPKYKAKRRTYMKEYHKTYYLREEVIQRRSTPEFKARKKEIDRRYREKKIQL